MPAKNGFIYFNRTQATALMILLFLAEPVTGQQGILDSLFSFNAGQVKTGTALSIISKATGYSFTYDSRLINTEIRTKLSVENEPLSSILKLVLNNDSVAFSVIDKYIIISRVNNKSPLQTSSGDTTAQTPETGVAEGVIKDSETGEALAFAAVALKKYGKGTVANNNGEFRLTIPANFADDTLLFTYLGFISREIPLKQALGNNLSVSLVRDFVSIPEIIIRTQIPQEIILKAVAATGDNYGNTAARLTAFYREGVMKKNELQSYSEAVLQIYKSPYTSVLLNDQIKVYKSRKIENTDATDTLAIRLKAGLSTCLELDGMKNSFDFMSKESHHEYLYRITDIVTYDGESAYVIDFEQKEEVEIPLYRGTVYINASDFAVLYADFELHPKYISRMKESFISSSARGFTTWPLTVKYSVSYRKINNRYFLSHVRGDLVFTSRQKKKLFNSQFNVFFEMAVTGVNTTKTDRFDKEELAPIHAVFSRTISSYDQAFWENQDFLKPEDNLLQALENMKVRLQEFSGEQY
jgi:hypothetical protein